VNAPAGAVLGGLAGRRYLTSRFGLRIPSYTAMLYVGCTVGVLVGSVLGGTTGIERSRFALAMTVLLVPALAGARLWFVVEHWAVFRREPRRIWRRSDGGAALHGGLLLSVAASVPFLALVGIPFWAFWDAASFTMLIGLVFTRIGCLMNGCCAGRATTGRLGVLLPDGRGVWERRVPTPLLEAGWATLVLAAAALARAGSPSSGTVFLGVLAAYGAARLVLEPTRATAGSRGSRANLAISALLIAVSCALLAGSLPWVTASF
jgi:phosphatidylglycerol:prolipoprotein diacylglycerol transferase